jgi:CDP-diacylglycerol--glycerol-3-phosphate 3-phosphatidyltransferase
MTKFLGPVVFRRSEQEIIAAAHAQAPALRQVAATRPASAKASGGPVLPRPTAARFCQGQRRPGSAGQRRPGSAKANGGPVLQRSTAWPVDVLVTTMASPIALDLRTTPNLITLSRIGFLVLGVAAYFHVSRALGLGLCVVAGLTDYLDGYIARRTGQVTRLGALLDQFCDVCFESFLLIMATVRGFFPPLLVCAYLFREFWVACLRRHALSPTVQMPSSLAGKLKTNLLMWGFLPTYLAMEGYPPGAQAYLGYAGFSLVALGLVASYVSAWGYTRIFLASYGESRIVERMRAAE